MYDINITENYSIEHYLSDIDAVGLEQVWDIFLTVITDENQQLGILSVKNFGELYEIGLAHVNKEDKKVCGKYYTPEDVASVMAQYCHLSKKHNICDVCCGTGNLILSYLSQMKHDDAQKLILEGCVYLYDKDALALHICQTTIGILYGKESSKKVHCIQGDFLSKNIRLPDCCCVISNPPYFRIKEVDDNWDITENIIASRELYSAIMEKILRESESSVIITPYSFVSGQKFNYLRREMSKHNGYVFSFDNVPGSVFNGKKHGIFNSNTSNSVRASITVTENLKDTAGYRISPLIRFKNSERKNLFQVDCLNSLLPHNQQCSVTGEPFWKCDKELHKMCEHWMTSKNTLESILVNNGDFVLCVPNSCRYYTVASKKDLDRTGKYLLHFATERDMLLAYAFLNSSFAYLWWRMYDGGITYPKSLLTKIPIFFDSLDLNTETRLISLSKEMIAVEKDYLTYKKNAGKIQENIKFDKNYLRELNDIWLTVVGFAGIPIEKIHKNSL